MNEDALSKALDLIKKLEDVGIGDEEKLESIKSKLENGEGITLDEKDFLSENLRELNNQESEIISEVKTEKETKIKNPKRKIILPKKIRNAGIGIAIAAIAGFILLQIGILDSFDLDFPDSLNLDSDFLVKASEVASEVLPVLSNQNNICRDVYSQIIPLYKPHIFSAFKDPEIDSEWKRLGVLYKDNKCQYNTENWATQQLLDDYNEAASEITNGQWRARSMSEFTEILGSPMILWAITWDSGYTCRTLFERVIEMQEWDNKQTPIKFASPTAKELAEVDEAFPDWRYIVYTLPSSIQCPNFFSNNPDIAKRYNDVFNPDKESEEEVIIKEPCTLEKSQISDTTQIEEVQIIGYDARAVTNLQMHDGSNMIEKSSDLDSVIESGERVAIYVTNNSEQKIVLGEVSFGGFAYCYVNVNESGLGEFDTITEGQLLSGDYTVLTGTNEIKAGQTVTILLDLESDLRIGRAIQFEITTLNGNEFVGKISVGRQSG